MLVFKRKSLKVLTSVVRAWCGRAFCRAVGGREVSGVSEPPAVKRLSYVVLINVSVIFSMSHMKHQIMWFECASNGGGRQLCLVLQLLSLLFAAESFYSAKWHCIFKFRSSGLLWSIKMSLSADNDTTLCHATLILFPFNGAQGYFSSSEALLP